MICNHFTKVLRPYRQPSVSGEASTGVVRVDEGEVDGIWSVVFSARDVFSVFVLFVRFGTREIMMRCQNGKVSQLTG